MRSTVKTQIVDTNKPLCPLCNKPGSSLLASELRRGTGIVYFCADCEHGYLVDNPHKDAKAYYDGEYRKEVSHKATVASTNPKEIFDTYVRYQSDRLEVIVPNLTKSTRLLEVGASAGQFIAHVKDLVALVHAIELDSECASFLRSNLNVEVETEFLSESEFHANKYDIVCAFQVLEHVGNASQFIESLKQVCEYGGKIFVEVPSLHDPLRAVWAVPEYEKFYFHSEHLHYFSAQSLTRAAVMAGFRPDQVSVRFSQDYNVLNHVNWILNRIPQPECHFGLSDIRLDGVDREIASWLSDEMQALNRRYIERLQRKGKTSNLMLIISND